MGQIRDAYNILVVLACLAGAIVFAALSYLTWPANIDRSLSLGGYALGFIGLATGLISILDIQGAVARTFKDKKGPRERKPKEDEGKETHFFWGIGTLFAVYGILWVIKMIIDPQHQWGEYARTGYYNFAWVISAYAGYIAFEGNFDFRENTQKNDSKPNPSTLEKIGPELQEKKPKKRKSKPKPTAPTP